MTWAPLLALIVLAIALLSGAAPSLSVPDPHRLPAGELAGAYEAVRLFAQRAQEQQPDFALTAQNARAVAEMYARLDGMPLAIELAAARVASMSLSAIVARLDDRFRLLTGSDHNALLRQSTMRATLDWSYNLLSRSEQTALQRLAVFAGGWTLEAAEAVIGAGDGIVAGDVADLLSALALLVHLDHPVGCSRLSGLAGLLRFSKGRMRDAGSGHPGG
jgi:predicted ATPase